MLHGERPAGARRAMLDWLRVLRRAVAAGGARHVMLILSQLASAAVDGGTSSSIESAR